MMAKMYALVEASGRALTMDAQPTVESVPWH